VLAGLWRWRVPSVVVGVVQLGGGEQLGGVVRCGLTLTCRGGFFVDRPVNAELAVPEGEVVGAARWVRLVGLVNLAG
jgi:hypothetical protein